MQLNIQQAANAALTRGPAKPRQIVDALGVPMGESLGLRGEFTVEHWRGGKRIDARTFRNGIVDEGKNALLNIMFDGGTQITTWYIGLIDLTGYSALANDDTYDDINQAGNGWDEFTSYTDPADTDSATTRPVWNPDAASGQAITNGTVRQFDITGSGTVKGVFIVGGGSAPEDKGDHASGSTLWSTALFSGGDVPVVSSDALKVTYTVNF